MSTDGVSTAGAGTGGAADAEVVVTRDGATAVLSLNAPQRRNVLSAGMVAAIGAAYDELEAEPEVRCVVITGTGPAFCAGAELATLEAAAAGDFAPVQQVYEGFLRVLRSPLVSIAAVNGPAVGAGFNLALACDLRLAGAGARFDTRFAALRLHPGGGHTWLLTKAVGPQQALLGCLFGEIWDAAAALRIGLVTAVHPSDRLVAEAIELGARLGAQDGEYTRQLTETLRLAASASFEDVLALETTAQRWSLEQPAFLDGLARVRARMSR